MGKLLKSTKNIGVNRFIQTNDAALAVASKPNKLIEPGQMTGNPLDDVRDQIWDVKFQLVWLSKIVLSPESADFTILKYFMQVWEVLPGQNILY